MLTSEDKVEILELAARYCHAVDHLDAAAYADVFTEDGELYSDGKLRARGRQQFIQNIADAKAKGLNRRHWTCNPVIDGDGDQARLRLYVMSVEYTRSLTPYFMGEYDDSLVKVHGRWKFKVRRVTGTAGATIV